MLSPEKRLLPILATVLLLAVAASARAWAASPKAEGTLFRRLRTPPLLSDD
jgi:hypothetical protein